ncbi:MAG: hypothetical protein IJX98_01935 [Clostridia bacterium]|nr:hypothetical protein [Clostridia bacterium]
MNYYELFGLTPDATDEELQAAYERLREKYREERWQEGEAGNEAARKLTQLESAYKELIAERKQQSKNTDGASAFEEISRLLKDGNLNEAQMRLDDFNERTAEWHYLQAVVFYKKNWMNDSKKQLEIAMQMDPSNVKYREAYGKLNAKNDYEQRQKEESGNPYSSAQPIDEEPQQMGGTSLCSNCCSCCYTYLCVDFLFSLCCGCR